MTAISTGEISPSILNHQQMTLPIPSIQGRVLKCLPYLFFPLGIYCPLVGGCMRTMIDLSNVLHSSSTDRAEQCMQYIQTACSCASLGSNLFAASNSFQYIETGRSLVVHTHTLYKQWKKGASSTEKLHTGLHLLVDVSNALLLRTHSVRLQQFSLATQLMVGCFDIKTAAKESYFGAVMQLFLNLSRAHSLISLSRAELPSVSEKNSSADAAVAIKPESSSTDTAPAAQTHSVVPEEQRPLLQPGTGSERLKQFHVIKYLGRQGLSGERFLVKDPEGNERVLKRFFRTNEKVRLSPAYALARLIVPFACDYHRTTRMMEISNTQDPNIIRIFERIKNRYSVEDTRADGTKMTMSVTDTYLVMEYLDWQRLALPAEQALSLLGSLTDTLIHLACKLNCFYKADTSRGILSSGDRVKFTNFDSFTEIRNTGNFEENLRVYDSLHKFFLHLLEQAHLQGAFVERLNQIFYLSSVKKAYDDADSERKKVMEKECAKLFEADSLRELLLQVKKLWDTESTPQHP